MIYKLDHARKGSSWTDIESSVIHFPYSVVFNTGIVCLRIMVTYRKYVWGFVCKEGSLHIYRHYNITHCFKSILLHVSVYSWQYFRYDVNKSLGGKWVNKNTPAASRTKKVPTLLPGNISCLSDSFLSTLYHQLHKKYICYKLLNLSSLALATFYSFNTCSKIWENLSNIEKIPKCSIIGTMVLRLNITNIFLDFSQGTDVISLLQISNAGNLLNFQSSQITTRITIFTVLNVHIPAINLKTWQLSERTYSCVWGVSSSFDM